MTTLASADVFRAISDPTRRAVLDRLAAGELGVGEIASAFDSTLSAISQHLKVLLDTGLVTQRREGRQRIYALNPEPLREVSEWVTQYERFWTQRLDRLGKYLDENP